MGNTDQPYDLGRYFCADPHHALLHHVLGEVVGYDGRGAKEHGGIALEFGVGQGKSLNCIASYLPVVGFDSFEGLPEDWRPGYLQGEFAGEPPYVHPNATIVRGLFRETLPELEKWEPQDVALIHLDADLYSSTRTVLHWVEPFLTKGTVVIFDEWHGYPQAHLHEQKAWREFATGTKINWTVIGHGHEAWGIQIA